MTLDMMRWFEEFMDAREYALDHIDTFTAAEIATMVQEGLFTVDEAEVALRRRIAC